MEKDIAIPIVLEVWQITSEYAIVEQYDDSLLIRFQYWNEKQEKVRDKNGLLLFKNVYAVRYCCYNKTRYYPKEVEHSYKSYYLEIPNSSWLAELKEKRESYDKNWEKYDHRNYKHYVFLNNSYYIEIIATCVDFQVESRLAHYNKIWNEV